MMVIIKCVNYNTPKRGMTKRVKWGIKLGQKVRGKALTRGKSGVIVGEKMEGREKMNIDKKESFNV